MPAIMRNAQLELEPDRGSAEIAAEFARLLSLAETEDATVAIVDFSGHLGWRRHSHLAELYSHPRCDLVRADEDGWTVSGFQPYRHFEDWRKHTRARVLAKGDHRARVLTAVSELPQNSAAKQAIALNLLGLTTHTGKPWTGDNLRKFLASGSEGKPAMDEQEK